ncbi:MAG: polysaccharide deacetylase family protein [Saprospiraceae bacterium]|nr:polysaccharide deacetylase family protein [Saprospiraceae bacterium]
MKLNRLTNIALCICCLSGLYAQAQPTLPERLGYSKDAKLLIIHADDLAVAHSENQASFKAMKEGSVNSASVMVPCPWLPEVAAHAKANPNHDLGLHLTLTSEWKHFKWGPVSDCGELGGLVDSNGYFFDNCASFASQAKPEAVEAELRAQVEKAKAMGIEPTHLDSHMGCLFFQNPMLFGIYLKLGREYGIPTMVGRDLLSILPDPFKQAMTEKDIVLDRILTASPDDYQKGMANYYTSVLQNLQPGVSIILIHTAYDDAEMKGVSIDHPDWGAAWRQADYDFFTSDACRNLLKEQNIQLITWREIGKLLR